MNKKVTGSILLMIIIGIVSCKQKPNYQYIDTAFKAYFDYQPGSYWIFYDSINHHTDSLVVTEYTDQTPQMNSTFHEEGIEIGIRQYDKDSMADSIVWDLSLATPSNSFLHTGATVTSPAVDYNFVKQIPFNTSTNVVQFEGLINGVAYSDLYRVQLLPQTPDFFYINADVGFIKISLDDQYWKKQLYLVKYHLKR